MTVSILPPLPLPAEPDPPYPVFAPDDPASALSARALAPDASAADCCAFGYALLARGGADRAFRRAALAALARAARLDPHSDTALLRTLTQTAFGLRDWPLVSAASAHLLARDANDANALVWRSAAALERNDFASAEALLIRADACRPDHPVVLHKLALCVKEQARFDEAEALLRRALALASHSAHACFDLSELELRSARFVAGWTHYEARLALGFEDNGARAALAQRCAPWQGESLAGRTLIVYGEQGNGDCLWALRFLPALAARAGIEGGRVIVGYDGPMRGLFERALPPGVALEARLDTEPDFHAGIMSLPLRLGAFDPTGWGRPYLRADPQRIAAWRARVELQARAGRRAVGIVWNGNPEHVRDARRSVPPDQFAALLTVPGITFFALSPGRGATVEAWRSQGADVVDPTAAFEAGFDDVAALIACLDHVVTIDSGPAHLAGALGRPTSLLIDHVSAWFWGNETARTPWYDSIALFRQPRVGDWAPVLAAMRARLERLAG